MRLLLLTTLAMVAFAANSLLNRAALPGGHIGPCRIRRFAGGQRHGPALAARHDPVRGGIDPAPPQLAWGRRACRLSRRIFLCVSQSRCRSWRSRAVRRRAVDDVHRCPCRRGAARLVALAWHGGSFGRAYLSGVAGRHHATAAACIDVDGHRRHRLGCVFVEWAQGVGSLDGNRLEFPVCQPDRCSGRSRLASGSEPSATGVALAVVAGAITSALGYALWYYVLPALGATTGALTQLSVPVLALVGGALLLAEPITIRATVASGLILGGIGLGVLGRKPTARQGA